MLRHYSFLPVVSFLLIGLAWLSSGIQSFSNIGPREKWKLNSDLKIQATYRRALIESMDRAVVLEHYYHSVHGKFADSLKKAGYELPSVIQRNFSVKVLDATEDKLQITCFALRDGKEEEVASIDQDFNLNAKFEVPPPSVDYLKQHALTQLYWIKAALPQQIPTEQGVFKGYFNYSEGLDGKGRFLIATGIRPPVLGVRIEYHEPLAFGMSSRAPSSESTDAHIMGASINVPRIDPRIDSLPPARRDALDIEPISSGSH